MSTNRATSPVPAAAVIENHLHEILHRRQALTDRFFAWLLLGEWAASLLLALLISPLAWEGRVSSLHPHVWVALLVGGTLALYPAWLGLREAGRPFTRHLIAAAQVLFSALLIHLTGGRIETHFHVFVSLAILAFYRDSRVLYTATAIVCADHLLRGLFWPESVFGVFTASPWRTLEHGSWVLFEVVFLRAFILRSIADMRQISERQLTLEQTNADMDRTIAERTRDLSRSEERFRALFEEAPVGLYKASPSGTLLMANPTLIRMLGYGSFADLRGVGIRLQGDAEEAWHRAFLIEAATKEWVQGHDSVWRHRDGSSLFIRESVKVLRDVRGEILAFEGSVEDVTDRRKLEENCRQAQKMQAVGHLAGGVAHDFNNILTAILGYADMASAFPGLPADPRRYMSEIKLAATRAAALTQQLLALSRKQTLQPRIFSFNTIVTDMDPILRHLAGERIDILIREADDLGPATADPGQMQQVLTNLVTNARDAMPQGGRLTIETANAILDPDYCRLHPEANPGDYVMLAVSDNGVGMTSEVQGRLFEPFFTTKDPSRGAGLGLATCHGIVKQSDGHLSVYSEHGYGSTFRVYIPRAAEPPQPSPSSRLPLPTVSLIRPRGGDETVLFVEDEPMVRQLGVTALASAGYRVLRACEGVDALRQFRQATFAIDLIVTDVVMPEMGGAELARHLRDLEPGIPILFTSGYTRDAISRTDLLEEGTHFLSKPYSMKLLLEKVREILDEKKVPFAPIFPGEGRSF